MTSILIRSLINSKFYINSIFSKKGGIYKRYFADERYQNLLNDKNFSQPLESIRKYSIISETSTMRFIQYHMKNETNLKLGVVSEDGSRVAELGCQNMVDFIKSGLSEEEIQNTTKDLPEIPMSDDFVLLPPVTNPQKIVCIGLNYSGHCKEQNLKPPSEPMFFSKYANTLVGPTGNIIAHSISNKIDWEVELAVIIGTEAKNICKEDALNYVFGYTIAQDISARDWQKERNGGQFLIGKSMDTFCPLGPAIVHKSLIKDPHNLLVKCCVNGEMKQCGNTSEMIYRIDDIIASLTQSITLLPGDVILTGTPSGVGMHRKPPEYLKPGDVIETEIQCLGKMTNLVVAP